MLSELSWVKRFSSENHNLLNRWKIHKIAMIKDGINSDGYDAPEVPNIDKYLSAKKSPCRNYEDPAINHSGKNWFLCDDKYLLELYGQGKSGNEIAIQLRRTLAGVRSRLVRLGAIPNRRSFKA